MTTRARRITTGVALATGLATSVVLSGVLLDQSVPQDAGILCAQPPTLDTHDALVMTPTSHASWSAALTALGSRSTILLTPGDYTPLGTLTLSAGNSGTAHNPRQIRYHGPRDYRAPVHRRHSSTEAKIHGIFFSGAVTNWYVRGLTLRATAADGLVHVLGPAAANITFDELLIEDQPTVYGVRIRDSDNVCVQRSVIRNNALNTETVGIQIKPLTTPVTRVSLVSNEIYDWLDSIQITDQGSLAVNFRILNNDLYITPARYRSDPTTGLTYACAENGIDLKTGDAAVTSHVHGNRMWGFRETPPPALWTLCDPAFNSGSAGDAIVIHLSATNVDIRGNVIGDSMHAMRSSFQVGGRRLTFNRNYVYDVPALYGAQNLGTPIGYDGAVLVIEDDTLVEGNVLVRSPNMCPLSSWPQSSWSPGPPTVSNNYAIGAVNYGACTTATPRVWNPRGYPMRVQRRQYTGPEWHTFEAGNG